MNYKCKTCGMCFNTLQNLGSYSKIHKNGTGTSCFRCQICEKKFDKCVSVRCLVSRSFLELSCFVSTECFFFVSVRCLVSRSFIELSWFVSTESFFDKCHRIEEHKKTHKRNFNRTNLRSASSTDGKKQDLSKSKQNVGHKLLREPGMGSGVTKW
jgi:hypothetical protein